MENLELKNKNSKDRLSISMENTKKRSSVLDTEQWKLPKLNNREIRQKQNKSKQKQQRKQSFRKF